MRFILKFLMILCVLAGLNARVLAADRHHECSDAVETCCAGDLDVPTREHGGDHDGKSCPLDHHHHGCCSHVLPLTLDHHAACGLGFPGSSLLSERPEREVAPEGPFLGSEKPPLI